MVFILVFFSWFAFKFVAQVNEVLLEVIFNLRMFKCRLVMGPATRHSELRRWLWEHGFALAADRPVQAAGRWYAVMAAEYTGEVRTPTFTECLFGRTAEWPEGAGYAAWQKAKLPRFRLGVPDGTELAEEIDKLLDGSPSQTR